ncbi:uncharacterized protein CELE_C33D3.4 [Caenorhabditis elegans]|uniref:Uncharacterized protein n=1 Tax=Caenorhabditis elegans TaxID=6239 RepID=Q18370_CAEEL|nr:Uncharacterized protein CELE_C33D3.4 [Caenorhabditis elegans]CAA90028.2 Uncharacterized protein CELE_C33D3.4 [Caenorhabditis elegans]|eukprot:NP_509757.2 Uncharacterized protein CELE_C33D3.4 [Caenorhabditis elegans]
MDFEVKTELDLKMFENHRRKRHYHNAFKELQILNKKKRKQNSSANDLFLTRFNVKPHSTFQWQVDCGTFETDDLLRTIISMHVKDVNLQVLYHFSVSYSTCIMLSILALTGGKENNNEIEKFDAYCDSCGIVVIKGLRTDPFTKHQVCALCSLHRTFVYIYPNQYQNIDMSY